MIHHCNAIIIQKHHHQIEILRVLISKQSRHDGGGEGLQQPSYCTVFSIIVQ